MINKDTLVIIFERRGRFVPTETVESMISEMGLDKDANIDLETFECLMVEEFVTKSSSFIEIL